MLAFRGFDVFESGVSNPGECSRTYVLYFNTIHFFTLQYIRAPLVVAQSRYWNRSPYLHSISMGKQAVYFSQIAIDIKVTILPKNS